MIESIMLFFRGDEIFAMLCILPLSIALAVAVMKMLVKLSAKLIGLRKTGGDDYVDAEYHKEITAELFVPPTQIDTSY